MFDIPPEQLTKDAAFAAVDAADDMRARIRNEAGAWAVVTALLSCFLEQRYAEAIAAIRHRPNSQFYGQAYLAACHGQLGEDEAQSTCSYRGRAPIVSG